MIDLSEVIKELNPKVEMVRDEGTMLPEDIDYAQAASIIEEDNVEKAPLYETLVFVDSRRRTFESINILGYVALLSQIVTGAVVFEDGRCQTLFSPGQGPESKLVLAIPHALAKILGINEEYVRLGNLICRVAIGNSAKIALDSFMQELERVHVSRYTDDFLTIKDGSIDFATPSFQIERGPVGLVKNIQKAFVSFEVFTAYSSMQKSQRSKSISTKLVTDNTLLRIMSYLKLVATSGLRGLVRIETIIEEERFGSTKYQIFETFNRLASTLSVLVDENFFIPRAPEDTLPVIFLERCLDRYFYNPRYIHCSVVEAFGGRETIM